MTWLAAFALGAATLAAAPAGTLDPSFGGNGRVVIDHGPGFDVARAVLVQPDAKIVLAGSGTPNGGIVVTRLNADGAPDAGFGAGGTARIDFGGAATGQAVALQPDGKILVAGAMEPHLGGAGVVARLNRDGSLDSSFAGDGRLTLGFRRAVSVLVQPDGRIAVGGESDGDLTVVRLYPDGSPDGTVFDRADFGGDDHHAVAALAPDGSILVAGTSSRFDHSAIAVARFKPDGALDPAFGYRGKASVVHANLGGVRSMGLSPDGRIVIVGFTADPFDIVVTRLRAGGRPDVAFGLEGTAEIDFGGRDMATGVVVQPDGAIVVGGITAVGHDMAAARLLPDGRLDPRFGSGGRATIDFGETDFAHAVALQPDGRVVLAGQTSLDGTMAVARLRADPPPCRAAIAGRASESQRAIHRVRVVACESCSHIP